VNNDIKTAEVNNFDYFTLKFFVTEAGVLRFVPSILCKDLLMGWDIPEAEKDQMAIELVLQ